MPSTSDEQIPIRGVNPPPPEPPPPPVSPVLRVLSLVLGLAGVAVLPTGPASLGLALVALSLALLAAVAGGDLFSPTASGDETLPLGKVNPPPPPRGRLLFHVLSLLVGAVGLYLLIRNLDSGYRNWGVHFVGAGLVLNLVDLIINLGRYRSPGAAR